MIQTTNTQLRPFFAAASQSDWYPALNSLIQQTPIAELRSVQEIAKAELKQFGFCVQGSQQHLLKIYLCRVQQLIHRTCDL